MSVLNMRIIGMSSRQGGRIGRGRLRDVCGARSADGI
jgi:hypothetical protein